MMTRSLCIGCLFLMLLPAGILRGQSVASTAASQRNALLATREAVWKSFYANDQARLKQLLPPDMIAINPGEKTWPSRAQFLASAADLQKHHGKLLSLDFPRTAIQRFGDVAVLYSSYTVRFEYDGQPRTISGRATEIFLWKDGAWTNPGWHVDSDR